MADVKKESSGMEQWRWLYYPLIIFPMVIMILGWLSGVNVTGTNSNSSTSTDSSINNKPSTGGIFSLSSWYESAKLQLGDTIINTKKVVVRNAPAGSIVGTQKKLEIGKIMEGPAFQFGTTWWRVDYPQAPDGWVEFDGLSSKLNLVRAFNIIPLIYDFYKPIGYGLLFILLIVFIALTMLLRKEKKITKRKKELREEQYAEVKKPIEEIVHEKPDVEQLPGFQTEEIVPVKIAEENGRWAHIQELIKSYSQNDWRQAIIEADIILEEMLEKMGYQGVSIGDKLKNIERSDFITLDRAWSAHKVRNQIAHDGSSFKLSRDLAERTIKDFEEVFREFYYI